MTGKIFLLATSLYLLTIVVLQAGTERTEDAILLPAPNVPPPITRKEPAIVRVHLNAGYHSAFIAPKLRYVYWTFNDQTPAPMIRARQGDTLEILLSSMDDRGMSHNIDFHAVEGPGGGAPLLNTSLGELKIAWLKLLTPGLFVYHCAQQPMAEHIANGMYGLILVEPEGGLPKVDHEFYIMQSEFYTTTPPVGAEATLEYAPAEALMEHPTFVVFNGKVDALNGENSLRVKTGERVRLYFGNIGPNLDSSFHIIGSIFETLYRDGDLVDQPAHGISVILVPAGGTSVAEMTFKVPGEYTMLDHSMFRIQKGATGTIKVEGAPRPDIYRGE